MKTYTVTVTGTWDIDIEASSPEQAERSAYQECIADGIDVELMNHYGTGAIYYQSQGMIHYIFAEHESEAGIFYN